MLFCAYRHVGDLDGYSLAEAALQRLAPDRREPNVYERLFLGYAKSETHIAITDGVATLKSVVQERPSWAIARAMLAQALANLGDDSRNPQYLDDAIRELSIATSLLPENPFVLLLASTFILPPSFMPGRTDCRRTLPRPKHARTPAC